MPHHPSAATMSDAIETNSEKTARPPAVNNVSDHEKATFEHGDVLADQDVLHEAYRAENFEHESTMWQAAKAHPQACFWAFIMAFTIVMESFDMFLNGNMVAQIASPKLLIELTSGL